MTAARSACSSTVVTGGRVAGLRIHHAFHYPGGHSFCLRQKRRCASSLGCAAGGLPRPSAARLRLQRFPWRCAGSRVAAVTWGPGRRPRAALRRRAAGHAPGVRKSACVVRGRRRRPKRMSQSLRLVLSGKWLQSRVINFSHRSKSSQSAGGT